MFQLLKIMYQVPRYTNCDNQPRFEECWVRSGIQHEKQSLENLFEKILHVCAHVAKETALSPGLGTKQKDLFNKYFQVEIDRRMVDFIVGLDSEMQQLVDACSKTDGLKLKITSILLAWAVCIGSLIMSHDLLAWLNLVGPWVKHFPFGHASPYLMAEW